MALAQTYGVYLVIKGDYTFTDQENWQFGIRYFADYTVSNPPSTGTPSGNDTDAASVARTETNWNITSEWLLTASTVTFSPDDWLNDSVAPALHTAFGAGISHLCRVQSMVAYPIGANGKVVDQRKAVLTWTSSNPVGSGGSAMLPMEDTVAVSWNTDEIGRKGRGRIYLPPADVTLVDTHGFVDPTPAGDIRDAWATFLVDSAQSPTGPVGWRVWPAVMPQVPTRYGIITSVRVGNVVDRQARRRRNIPETYNAPAAVSH